MGITVGELLNLEFFKDFQVIAGKKGLNREIQSVTILDAPDGYRWAVGKELTLTSGYVFAHEPETLELYKKSMAAPSNAQAAMVIKRGRYLDEIPEDLILLHDRQQIPLITMPYSIPWMETINQVNVAVMNHAIQRFCVNINATYTSANHNYKEQKIRRMLQTVENEMEFPAMVYDVFENKSYYSSPNFLNTSEQFGLEEQDYWNPSISHTSHTLCDCIHMTRYRLLKGEAADEPRISWVVIPILAGGVPQAYFCVMESRRFMDFYDEYSMRIAYLMLQSLYEQLSVARDASNLGFENLIHLAMDCSDEDYNKLVYQANQLNMPLDKPYRYVLLSHDHATYDLRSRRSEMIDMFQQCTVGRYGRLAFLSKTEGIIVLENRPKDEIKKEDLTALLREYEERLQRKFGGIRWTFSYSNEQRELTALSKSVEKCRKIMRIGRIALPEQSVLDYDELGILTWLDIPDEELKQLLEQFRELMKAEKNRELLQTLKVYLENNMNFSVTAEKLYVNINTIRRRIEKINELIQIDWDNYFERTKIGLMLQFLQ